MPSIDPRGPAPIIGSLLRDEPGADARFFLFVQGSLGRELAGPRPGAELVRLVKEQDPFSPADSVEVDRRVEQVSLDVWVALRTSRWRPRLEAVPLDPVARRSWTILLRDVLRSFGPRHEETVRKALQGLSSKGRLSSWTLRPAPEADGTMLAVRVEQTISSRSDWGYALAAGGAPAELRIAPAVLARLQAMAARGVLYRRIAGSLEREGPPLRCARVLWHALRAIRLEEATIVPLGFWRLVAVYRQALASWSAEGHDDGV